MAPYDKYPASGEINSVVEDVAAATDRVRDWAREQGARTEDFDGLGVEREGGPAGPRWWFSLRPSNTEPLLRLNVEADDEPTMTSVRDEVLSLVRGSGA